MEIIENYRAKWKNHVLQIPCSRIPLQTARYQPNGSKENLWEDTTYVGMKPYWATGPNTWKTDDDGN
jgi:hypothetical protein